MEELNKKIVLWVWPETSHPENGPDFPNDIKACFEYIVPKFKYCSLVKPEHKGFNGMWLCELRIEANGRCDSYHAEDKLPTIVLCRAVEKLVDAGG